MEEVHSGIWRAGTRYVNWYVLDGGSAGLTVIDGGLPGYASCLASTLHRIGRTPADVRAVLLTHGHVDHTGVSGSLAEAGAAVYLHAADETLAADPRTNSTQEPLLKYAWWPATAAFVAHALRQQATKPGPMPKSIPMQPGEVLPVPGDPVVMHLPGHTDGSCAFHFRDHDVVFIGDALCTSDPFSGRRTSPQVQTKASNADSAQALTSLEKLQHMTAKVLLPGHGDPWRDGVESALASARKVGCR